MKARRVTFGLTIVYLLILLVGWVAIEFDSGDSWLVTLFLFSPRWVVALPLLILLPLTLFIRARQLPLYILHGLVIVFPLLGFQLAVHEGGQGSVDLRMMSCNLGEGQVQVAALVDRVQRQNIDLLMLQECPTTVSIPLFEQLGWYHEQQDNVAIGSHYELSDSIILERQPPTHHQVAAAVYCELKWRPTSERNSERLDKRRTVQLVCLHLPTFRPAMEKVKRFETGSSDAIQTMAMMYREVARDVRREVDQLKPPVIVAGDFNVPVESAHYHDFWDSFENAIDQAGWGLAYTKYTRFHGVRIDHVLTDGSLKPVQARAGDGFGGDHRPVVVDYVWREDGQ